MELFGAIAQLGERLNGIQEVRGSIPRSSTNPLNERTENIDKCGDVSMAGWPYDILGIILKIENIQKRLLKLDNAKIKYLYEKKIYEIPNK